MAEQQTTVTADAGTGGQTTLAGQASVAQGGTPSPATVEAAVGGGDSVEALKERAAYLEREAKKAFEKRDKALEEYRASDEYKSLVAARDELAKQRKAQLEAEEQAAKQRGEYERLYTEEKAKREATERDVAEKLRKQNEALVRREVRATLRDVKAKDLDILVPLALADGSIKVGDDGDVAGVPEVVKKLVEAKPYLFDTGASEALKRLGVTPGSLATEAAKANDIKNDTKKPGYGGCLAAPDLGADFANRFSWRAHLKPKQ